jgi:hypothetical protein
MQMLYNSDSFVVVQFDRPGAADAEPLAGGIGFEIVDKLARTDIYLQGALAERFQRGAQLLMSGGETSEEAIDDYIAGFTGLPQQPLCLH